MRLKSIRRLFSLIFTDLRVWYLQIYLPIYDLLIFHKKKLKILFRKHASDCYRGMSGFYQRGYSNVIANENREFTKSARTCKILLNYIHKVETLKANLDEYKRISRRHLYEFGVTCIGLLFIHGDTILTNGQGLRWKPIRLYYPYRQYIHHPFSITICISLRVVTHDHLVRFFSCQLNFCQNVVETLGREL